MNNLIRNYLGQLKNKKGSLVLLKKYFKHLRNYCHKAKNINSLIRKIKLIIIFYIND